MAAEDPRAKVDRLARALQRTLGPAAVKANQPLARYTALRIGGPADLLVKVESIEMLRQATTLAWQEDVPCYVLGGGSNVLVSDAGVRGLVVLNRARAASFPPASARGGSRQRASVRAESGASFSTVARQSVAHGLAGLEWATGIPGTVGGAVVGNAGAWGSDVASSLVQATVLEAGGTVVEWPPERFQYAYRTSILKQSHGKGTRHAVVLDAEFALQEADREALAARVAEITARRKASQPPGATCGSVFKNPEGDYAGRLIEAAGLKGRRQGGAEISTVHANFFINHGGAMARDIKALIDLARKTVQARLGVTLALEIELLGDWG